VAVVDVITVDVVTVVVIAAVVEFVVRRTKKNSIPSPAKYKSAIILELKSECLVFHSDLKYQSFYASC
jgi:hypothetical protein